MHPDFGLFLLGQGWTRDELYFFMDFTTDHISVVGPGKLSTMSVREFDGQLYAMSVDFDVQIFQKLLEIIPPRVADFIRANFGEEVGAVRVPFTIELPERITFGFQAKIGDMETSAAEEQFVPFVIQEVF